MDLERSGKLLTSTSNYYDIGIIDENGNKVKVHRKVQPGEEGPELLKEVIQDYKPRQVFIDVFKPSGNSKHLETTLTIDVSPELLAGPEEEYETYDLEEMNNLPASQGQWFHHVIADQKELIQELKDTKRRLEGENDKLRKDKAEIEKELAFKDKETELKIRAIEQEHSYKEAAQENSLGAVGARMMENPVMAQALLGIASKLMGWNQPQPLQMQGPAMMGQQEPQQQGPGLDADMQQIVGWMNSLPAEKKQQFFFIIQACSNNMFLIDTLAELVQNEENAA